MGKAARSQVLSWVPTTSGKRGRAALRCSPPATGGWELPQQPPRPVARCYAAEELLRLCYPKLLKAVIIFSINLHYVNVGGIVSLQIMQVKKKKKPTKHLTAPK